jgi:hypothetical protein
MAGRSLPVAPGSTIRVPGPNSGETRARAWALLDKMDKQLLDMEQRCIAVRATIAAIKAKLLAESDKLDESETF